MKRGSLLYVNKYTYLTHHAAKILAQTVYLSANNLNLLLYYVFLSVNT